MEDTMEVMHQHCAGLDVHKKTVVACVRLASEGKVVTEVKTFATTTQGLLTLSDWLSENGCTHVAMEATGVYWKPVWHVLSDGEVELVLANAAHVKNVPGRKTDVSDAAWLAELLAHGLIRASFVPDGQTQELRALLRTRKQLVRERTRHVQRIHKTLEDANIKLDAELSNVLGKSGRAILNALVAGETDPVRLAALAYPNVKSPQAQLREALRGRLTSHHRFLLQLHLGQIDSLDAAIGTIDREVEDSLAPFRAAVDLVRTIPGVSTLGAEVIVSEIGLDMSRFPTVGHLVAWAGLSAQRRECRETPIEPSAQRRAVAQDHARPMQLGGQEQKGELSASPVSAPEEPPRATKGDLRRRRLHSHGSVPHAQRRNCISGSRSRSFQPPLQDHTNPAPGQAPRTHGLHRGH